MTVYTLFRPSLKIPHLPPSFTHPRLLLLLLLPPGAVSLCSPRLCCLYVTLLRSSSPIAVLLCRCELPGASVPRMSLHRLLYGWRSMCCSDLALRSLLLFSFNDFRLLFRGLESINSCSIEALDKNEEYFATYKDENANNH